MIDRQKLQAFYAQDAARKQAEAARREAAQRYAAANNTGAQYFQNIAAHNVTTPATPTPTPAATPNVADVADDVANVADGVAAAGKGGLGKITSGLGTAWNNVKSGKGIAPQYAKYANIAAGIGALNAAANGYSEYSNAVSDTEDLVSNILASAGGNPNLRYDLSSDQLQLLRRLQNGTYDTSAGFSIDGLMNNLGDVASGAGMGFLTGGWTGAALGALSPIASGITSGMTADQGRITAELEGLYNALRDSEMTTKDMKRNANMQRYANSIYGY